MRAVVAVIVAVLLALPTAAQWSGSKSRNWGATGGWTSTTKPSGASLTINAMPYTRTVTCGSYTLTGSASGAGAVSWSASPSGASGSCTGTTSWSCVVSVAPDATGEAALARERLTMATVLEVDPAAELAAREWNHCPEEP